MRWLDALHWELFLRGGVAALLLLHVVHLSLPGPWRAARAVLAAFASSVLAYLFCQRPDMLLALPRPLAVVLLALSVGSAAWLWASARALFEDDFRLDGPVLAAAAGLTLLGLGANLPWFPDGDGPFVPPAPGSIARRLEVAYALATIGLHAAALVAVLRDWRSDLVSSRRAARRWVALGIGLYAGIALVVDLAVRDRPVGALLPALHVAGIGTIALALGVWIARHSLDELLGPAVGPATPTPPVRDASPKTGSLAAPSSTAVAAAVALPVAPLPVGPLPTGFPPPAANPGRAAIDATVLDATAVASDPDERAARSSGLDARAARTLARLDAAMSTGRLYRREGLTLNGLAAELDVAPAPLRDLINRQLGHRNFNDYLHRLRLQEASARLATEDQPILTIALECGYGSIGPFNRAFRQQFGMTPTEYRAAARVARAARDAPAG